MVQCALRVATGSYPGLARRWVVGMAHVEPERIDFAPSSVKSSQVTVAVPGAPTVASHGVGRRGIWRVNPRARIIQLDVGDATIEWAVMPDDLDWCLTRLHPCA